MVLFHHFANAIMFCPLLQDSRWPFLSISLLPGKFWKPASLSYVNRSLPSIPGDLVTHDHQSGLSAGARLPGRPQLQDRLRPLPQDRIRDQIPHPQDPPRPKPLPLGEVQKVR